MKAETEIIKQLSKSYGEDVLENKFPRPFHPDDLSKVKAIYLGCDPSNKHSTSLPYVFAMESSLKVFNSFINSNTRNLDEIGLKWDEVYAQNLCQNYFKNETSKNLKLWKKVANEFWVKKLVKELEIFNKNIPVLLSAQYLLEVLGTGGYEKIGAPRFYECLEKIPVPPEFSKLGRALIPMYRGKSPKYDVSYHLSHSKWNNYKESIKNYLN